MYPEVKKLGSGVSLLPQRAVARRVVSTLPAIRQQDSIGSRTQGVRVGKHLIGGSSITWIAGPGVIESSAQMVSIGASLEQIGVKFIRASLPRSDVKKGDTRASFLAALKLLRATAKRYGMSVVAEITDIDMLDLMVEFCDIVEVRSSDDIDLVAALGEIDRTVILHRSPTMTVDDFLDSVRTLERGGRATIVLGERGVATADPRIPQMLDLSAMITLKRETPYPVVVDCSAVAMDASYADQLAVAAVAAGADGVMVDVVSAYQHHGVHSPSRAVLPYQLASMIRRIEALKFTLNALVHRECEERLRHR